jgi:hypothetical protein
LDDHLILLRTFLQLNFKALNYDTQQTYSLLSNFIKAEIKQNNSYATHRVVQQWQATIESANITCLEKLELPQIGGEAAEVAEAGQNLGYDLIMNLRGNFVVTLNTKREEICVWDVAKYV